MCGRYALTTTAKMLAEEFGINEVSPFLPRYNVAPTQQAPVIRKDGDDPGRLAVSMLKWGFIPLWAKDAKIGNSLINARADGVATKPAFRSAFKKRRCIVPISGFYEWQVIEGQKVKQPWFIHSADSKVMTLAGLWEWWKPSEGEPVESFTIITTDANDQMRLLHHRMPVILQPEDIDAWLNPDTDTEELPKLLVPAADGVLAMYPVSTRVNSPKNDDPDCIKPVDPDADSPEPSLFP